MNSETTSPLSNNSFRRMHGWARTVYPQDYNDRCAVVNEYLAQLGADEIDALVRKGWPDVFAAAERDWPEAFAGWKQDQAGQA
jgi:hypothetical protein